MKKVLLLSIFTGLLLGGVGVASAYSVYEQAQPAPIAVQTVVEKPATAESLLTAVNAERAKVGVKPLIFLENMQQTAQLKADDMWTRDYRQHKLPGSDYNQTAEMAAIANVYCSDGSENYVYTQDKSDIITTERAIHWWLNSAPHKKAMLDPQYTYTGFGIAHNNLVVEHFCVAKSLN